MCESPIKELVHSMKPAMTHEVACLLIVKILYYININILILKIAFCHYCKLSHSDGMICTQRDKETNTKLNTKQDYTIIKTRNGNTVSQAICKNA